MAKPRASGKSAAYERVANVSIQEFLEGESLHYQGWKRKCVATYRLGVGVLIEDEKGKSLGVSTVLTDGEAKRFYWNATRGRALTDG